MRLREKIFLLLPVILSAASLPEQALSNLRKVRSFRYVLKLSRTEPPIIAGEFSGMVILPDTVEQQGAWAEQPALHLKARGNIEYLRELPDTQWTVQLRGEEADFLSQVERALARDSFVLLSGDEFSFVPNVPFLDPLLNKQLSGRLRLSTDRVLPEEITVKSSDNVVSWQVKFSDYDAVPSITFPFVRQWRIALLPGDTQTSGSGALTTVVSDSMVLRQRLARHGWESQFDVSEDTLLLFLEREIRDELLSTLLQPGEVSIWIARRRLSRGPLPQGAQLIPLRADTTQKLVAEKLILSRQDFSRTTVADTSPGPLLKLILTRAGTDKIARHKALEKSGMFWVLVVDGEIAALTRIEKRRKADELTFEGIENLLAAQTLKTLLDSPVLTGRWQTGTRLRLR